MHHPARVAPVTDLPSTPAVDPPADTTRTVLHIGCGRPDPRKLHPAFRAAGWHELRVDIDPRVRPHIVASSVDLGFLRDGSCDAVWSSHNLEHLFEHEVRTALAEMVRVLKPDGFALITVPDIVSAARAIVAGRFEEPLYVSPAGPVTPVDMLFGFRKAIEGGNAFMAHRTGFTTERLGRVLVEAGFSEARVWDGGGHDLWAVGLMPDADAGIVGRLGRLGGLP
ncbi:class I SAM-dependent methyltransferase [uncultured Alsobacter sp.]|uniref:class I SAM-dependent methyltransferase n=1 Tax=uncultured Alsobacter sp. TaxID=1748258 RepID=UPI0025DD0C9E|nr:class I SAM-dependent methyltransferase [uncultured Alsobacter sp.]